MFLASRDYAHSRDYAQPRVDAPSSPPVCVQQLVMVHLLVCYLYVLTEFTLDIISKSCRVLHSAARGGGDRRDARYYY